MATATLRRVEGSKAWSRDVNTLIDAHLGNLGAQRLWVGWDGVVRNTNTGAAVTSNNYSDVVQNTGGRHVSVRHSAGTTDAPADQVLAANDGYVTVGRGSELRTYNAAGTLYSTLKYGTAANSVIDPSLRVATALNVGAADSAADVGDIFAAGGISVGVYSNPAQGELRFGNNASGLGYANATTSAAAIGSLSNIPLQLATNSTARIQLEAAGHMRPEANNTYDLGASSYGWKDVYVAGRIGVDVAPSVALHVSKSQAADYVAIFDNESNAASTKGVQIKSAGTGAADPVLNIEAGGAQIMNVFSAGLVGVGASPSNAFMTAGISIDQGANDNEALALKSSDVAHGITAQLDTTTYGAFQKQSATDGGLIIRSATEATISLHLQSFSTNEDSTRSTSGGGYLQTSGFLKSGTSVTSPSANVNLLAVRAGTSARFILDSDGDSHQDVGTAWTNFDDMQDIVALNTLSHHLARPGNPIREEFGRFLMGTREPLERAGIVAFNDGPGEDGRPFVNMSKLQMLTVGAVRQVGLYVSQLTDRIEQLEQRLAMLPSGGA